ncbi:MAG: hypothetical protein IKZ28_01840 [Clostridia bacterium]|nr:hypothetical protein [Clostridia bacterium]
MKTLHLHNLLLSLGGKGFIFTILLFLFCFLGVITVNLAKLGWEYEKQRTTPPPPPKSNPPQSEKPKEEPAPVYYIVEKKTRRAKASYSEPKQIHFKGNGKS